jgi:hypothetical protein
VITETAQTYNVMLAVILGDDAEPLALPNPIGPTILSADDLTGDFSYWADDAGTTPMSDFTKQQSLERLAPILVQLGADPALILKEMVRTFQLPADLAKMAEQPVGTSPTEPGLPTAPPAGDL